MSCCELRLLAKALWYPSLLGEVADGMVADSIDIGEAMLWEEGEAAARDDAYSNRRWHCSLISDH